MTDAAVAPSTEPVAISLPYKLKFLLDLHQYKVVYSGRFGMKTRSAVNALLALGAHQKLRILCCREVMNSIRESLHAEIKGEIQDGDWGGFWHVDEKRIVGDNGTEIIFAGLREHTIESIKSYANVDIALVDEARGVTKISWDMLIPTIRKPNSEIWVLFNPGFDEDDTWKRWVLNPPPNAIVVKTNWRDAQEMGWFPKAENQKRLHFQRTQPDDYDNVWEGVPRSTVEGAIYEREMAEAQNDGRIRPVPYDPRLPVHTVWDLGWRDNMAVIFVQKPVPTVVNIINYLEGNHLGYDEVVAEMDRLRYRWGTDYLPHDGGNHNPQTKISAKKTLENLGRKKVVVLERGDPDEGIRHARMMFPRVYFDNSERKPKTLPATAFLGVPRLLDRLKRYARKPANKTTGEQGELLHDGFDGCDAYRGLAMCVDRMKNDADRDDVRTPGFQGSVPGMGMLG